MIGANQQLITHCLLYRYDYGGFIFGEVPTGGLDCSSIDLSVEIHRDTRLSSTASGRTGSRIQYGNCSVGEAQYCTLPPACSTYYYCRFPGTHSSHWCRFGRRSGTIGCFVQRPRVDAACVAKACLVRIQVVDQISILLDPVTREPPILLSPCLPCFSGIHQSRMGSDQNCLNNHRFTD